MNRLKSRIFAFNILLILMLVVSLISCKKEIVDIPDVTYLYPYENAFYSVGDTIEVRVAIESISNIKSIEFKLVNSDLIPVSDNYNYPVDGSNKMTVNYALIIDDYYMQSDDYQILCKVNNEKEVKRKYQTIKITSVEKRLEDIAVVCKNSNKIQVYSLGSDLNSTTLKFEVNGDYSSSVYLPFHHRFALAGSVNGNMICWDYFSGDTLQNIPFSANPPFPFFSTLGAVNDYLAVGYYQGAVDLYNFAAYQKYSIVMETNYYPSQIFDLNDHFMVEEKQINGAKQLVSVRLDATASQYASFMLSGKIIGAYPFEGQDDILFYNDGNEGVIAKYIYADNANNYPITYNIPYLISSAQIDSKNYLLSTSTDLLWYQYQSSSITSIVNNVALKNLIYDKVTGRLYATEGQNIVVYSVPDGTLLNSINIGKEILALHLIYNK